MIPRRDRQRITAGLALLLASAALAWPATAPAKAPEVVVREAMLNRYPTVSLDVMVPPALAERGQMAFAVAENGHSAELLSAARKERQAADVLLLLDTSGSMEGPSMEAAKSAARAFMAKLAEDSRVGIISFADRPKLVVPLGHVSGLHDTAVQSLKADGETALHDALAVAAREAGRPEVKRPIVVLLSDGGDTVSRGPLDASLKKLRAVGAPVLVVALPSAEADFRALRTIASQTNGRFTRVASAGKLATMYEALAEEIQTTWHLQFVSNRPSTSDLDVRITATAGGATAIGGRVLPNPSFVPGDPDAPVLTDLAPANFLTLFAAVSLVFLSVFGAVVAAGLLWYRPRTGLADLRFYDQLHDQEDVDAANRESDRIATAVYGAVDYLASKRGIRRVVYELLEQAGLPLRPTEYITMHLLAVIAIGMTAQFVSGRMDVSLLMVFAATAIPIAWVRHLASARRKRFEEQLPDALTLMAGSLRAGWGLQQAIGVVVEQMADPIAAEFRRAQTEMRLGRPVQEALATIATRMNSADFEWAVTAIGIQHEVGGNLAEVLDIVATTIKERAALRRHISALTAEGRLSAIILMVLPFILLAALLVLNPRYMREMFTNPVGLLMLVFGAVLLVVGGYWLKRSTAIEV